MPAVDYLQQTVLMTSCCVICAGVPGVKPERMAEGMQAKHCALSLVGEPIMYPEINALAGLLHDRGISTFLVTNAQFPDAIRCVLIYNVYTCTHFRVGYSHNLSCLLILLHVWFTCL